MLLSVRTIPMKFAARLSLASQIAAMRDAGWTFREIATELHIAEVRARQLWNRAHSNKEIPGLVSETHTICLEMLAILRPSRR